MTAMRYLIDLAGVAVFAISGVLAAGRRGRLYATAAIVGAALYVLLAGHGVAREAAALAGMGVIAALRVGAIYWRLELPAVSLPEAKGS